MLPPETMDTTLPEPARLERPAATAHAAAPSIIIRFRSATTFTACAASVRVTTNDPSSSLQADSNIPGNTVLLPIPSTNDGLYSTNRGPPAANDATTRAAVATS